MRINMLHRLVLAVYSALWRLVRPFLRRHKRLRNTIPQRLVLQGWASPADIWLQAASGGEAYLAWEILKILPHTDTKAGYTRILATTWTEQGLQVLNNMRVHFAYERPDLHIQTAYFPFDEGHLMQRALRMVNPRVVALLETELWPSLLYACVLQNVPVCLLNGRISPKSLRHYLLMNTFTAKLWQALAPTKILAMSAADGERFTTLFGQGHNRERVSIAPNIKFDRAKPVLANTTPKNPPATSLTKKILTPSLPKSPLTGLLPNAPIILFASVREEEEILLLPVIQALYDEHPNALVIIAPRHMHRVQAWQEHCVDCPNVCLRSSLTPSDVIDSNETTDSGGFDDSPTMAKQGSLIIWDSFGELSHLYTHAKAVFVGGSLAKLGGQNILEPLAAGKIPCTGPHLANFLWALDLESTTSLPSAGLITVCQNARDVHAALTTALTQEDNASEIQERFATWLKDRLGGTEQNARMLYEFLDSPKTISPDNPQK